MRTLIAGVLKEGQPRELYSFLVEALTDATFKHETKIEVIPDPYDFVLRGGKGAMCLVDRTFSLSMEYCGFQLVGGPPGEEIDVSTSGRVEITFGRAEVREDMFTRAEDVLCTSGERYTQ